MAQKKTPAVTVRKSATRKASAVTPAPAPVPKKAKKLAASESTGPEPHSQEISKAAKPKLGAAAGAKQEKAQKPKLVRDSFTMPKSEWAALDGLKRRAAKLGAPARKSEVLRGGILALLAMPDEAFRHTMTSVPTLKTGRPSKA